jgi:AcrR family transcriptional regulator
MTSRLSRDARKAETRDALLHAGASLFARDGIDATSLERIAVELGLTKGAIYAHFASKKELVAAVLEAFENDPALLTMRAAYIDETKPFGERMRDVGRAGAELLADGVFGLSGLESILLDLESLLYSLRNRDIDVIDGTRHLIETWGAQIDEVQAARGEPLAMPGATLRLLLYSVFRGLAQAHVQDRELVTRQLFEDVFAKLAAALATDAPPSRRRRKDAV